MDIDDTGLSVDAFDDLYNLLQRLFRFAFGADLVVEVFAVKRREVRLFVLKAQVFDDIRLYFGRSGGGQGDDGRSGMDSIQHGAYTPVFRAEIVAPFGDTVGLVYGDKRYVYLSEELDIFVFGQGFRCDVEQFCVFVRDILLDLFHLRLGERGVEEVRHLIVLAIPPDGIHLVLHQGDQGGDDEGGPFQHEGR